MCSAGCSIAAELKCHTLHRKQHVLASSDKCRVAMESGNQDFQEKMKCWTLMSNKEMQLSSSPPSSVGRAQGFQPCGRGFEPHGGCLSVQRFAHAIIMQVCLFGHSASPVLTIQLGSAFYSWAPAVIAKNAYMCERIFQKRMHTPFVWSPHDGIPVKK